MSLKQSPSNRGIGMAAIPKSLNMDEELVTGKSLQKLCF